MKFIESSAKTMQEAISQGLEKLGVSLGDVTIDILDEGSKGLFGLIGAKAARVRLTVKEDDAAGEILSSLKAASEPAKPKARQPKAAPAPDQQPSGKPTPKPAEKKIAEKKPARKPEPKTEAPVRAERRADRGDLNPLDEEAEGKALEFLTQITKLMGVDVSIEVKRDEEQNIRVDMQGDTLGILIGRRGETLDALQYLASLYINKGREGYTRITLDTENYRAKREEALTRLANRMANRAVKTGRKVVLEPMNPYERRILHSALQQNDAVATHSEGEEPNRHVVITLK